MAMMDIKQLKPNERNPRTISREAFAKLCDNIQKDPEFLKCRPLLAYKNPNAESEYIVYAGNQRLRALKHLKHKQAPVIITDNDPDIIKNRVVLDNVSFGEFDYDMLSSDYELGELLGLGLDEKALHIDTSSPDDSTKEPDVSKSSECPNCGHILNKKKK